MPDSILELTKIVETEVPDKAEPTPDKDAQIWAFLGACGGCGVSSLCVSIATLLAAGRHTVLLVDLDFERGTLAAYLDQPPGMSLEELNQTEGRLDADLALSYIKPVDKNLSLLSCTPQLGGNDQISLAALLALLDVVSTHYDFMIIDVPALWRPWTEAALGAADKVALVTEARVPALRQTAFLAEQIQDAVGLPNPPDIILNKYERRAIRNGLSLSDTHKALGRPTVAQIVVDNETLRGAIDTGIAAPKFKPNARYVKSVDAFIAECLNQQNKAFKKAG